MWICTKSGFHFGEVRIPHLFSELLGGKKTDRPGEEPCRIAAVSDAKTVKPSRFLLRPPLTATVNKPQRRRTISQQATTRMVALSMTPTSWIRWPLRTSHSFLLLFFHYRFAPGKVWLWCFFEKNCFFAMFMLCVLWFLEEITFCVVAVVVLEFWKK